MNQTPFPEFFEQSPIILGEGAVIEQLRRNTDFELDPFMAYLVNCTHTSIFRSTILNEVNSSSFVRARIVGACWPIQRH
jgi:hypothetical protein